MSGPSSYEPKTAIERWLDARLPIIRFSADLMDFPTPKNLNYWWTFGGILAFCLGVQIVTGIILAMHYDPSGANAFLSIEHIMRDVNHGWLIRYIHADGAFLFFLAVYIHMFRGIYYGSYKAPREVLWILGVIIYLLMMATAFMGYVLPWGSMSFAGATVITNLFTAIPVVGTHVATWLWGDFAVGDATLNRFFSLHYLLPFIIAAVVGLHIWALHVPGNNNPLGIDVKSPQDTVPFHPYYTVKDGFYLALFVLFFSVFVFYAPEFFGNPDNAIEANPLVTPKDIVPEWYLLPFYAILRSIPNKLLGVLAMFGSLGLLALVPWLDRSPVKSARFRPVYPYFFWLLLLDCFLLGFCGAHPPEGWYVIASRLGTAYFYLHFLLVLPLLAVFERPRPLPRSIGEAVLRHGSSPAALGTAAREIR